MEKSEAFQKVTAKLLHSSKTGADITLTGDEVSGYFEFVQDTMKRPQPDKDFDEFSFAVGNDELPIPPPMPEAYEPLCAFSPQMPIYTTFQQIKPFHNKDYVALHNDVNEFLAELDTRICGVTSIEHTPKLGFVMSVIYYDEKPFQPKKPGQV